MQKHGSNNTHKLWETWPCGGGHLLRGKNLARHLFQTINTFTRMYTVYTATSTET